MKSTTILILALVLGGVAGINSAAQAQISRSASVRENRPFVYHGKIVRPDGTVPTGSMKVTLRILSPDPQLCLLWKETQNVDVVEGNFTAELGHPVHRLSGTGGGAAVDFKQTFVNNPSLTISNAQCASGNTYTPTASDDRLLSATFEDAGVAIEISALPIKSVPFALQAEEIAGFGIANLAKISGAGSNVTYTPGEAQTLKDLLGGDIFFDMKSRAVKNVAAPTAATDAANKSYVDSSIATAMTGAGLGSVTNVSGTTPIAVSNGTSTPTISIATASGSSAGALSATDWNTFNGKQPAGNYLTGLTGDVVATGPGGVTATIQANAVTTSKIIDGAVTTMKIADGNITSVKIADGNVTTVKVVDKAITLAKIQDVATNSLLGRSTAGTGPAEVLTVGSGLSLSGGTLTATNTNAGTVTNVASTNSYVTVASGSTTPQITANVGTAANTLAAGNDSRITGALQKSGGTMTGAIDMGGQDLNNTGNIALAASKNLQLGTYGTDPSTAGWTTADKGKTWFNTTSNQVRYWDGSSVQALGVSGAGLTSLGGQSGSTQTFAAGAAGTAPAISSGGNVHTLNVPLASGAGVTSGTISKTDYDNFNGKVGAGYSLAGDVTGTPAATVVDRIKGKSVSASPTAPGQVLRYTGTQFDPAYLSMFDLRSTITGAQSFGGIGCTAGQTLTWTAATDNLSCTSIAITDAQVSGLGSLATKSAVDLATAEASGTLAAARFPSLTGAVTTTAGSLATTLGSNVVGSSNITDNSIANADLRQGVARSVIGVTGNTTANVADIQGTANQVLRVDNAGTGLTFGQLNLASSAAVTGILPAANMGSGTANATTYLRGDGSWQTPPGGADNLGNHTASQNLNLGSYKLVGNGGSAGISIDAGGNVGLGTTSPLARFHSRTSGGGTMAVFDDSNRDRNLSVVSDASGTDSYVGLNATDYLTRAANLHLVFQSGGNEKMRIQDTGNVGIGTATPGSRLTVNGTIETASGGVKFPDGSVQTSAGGTATVTTWSTAGTFTWTKPSAAAQPGAMAMIECWGSGGSGGRGDATNIYVTGGGGGGYVQRMIPYALLNATETVIVGAGGAAVSTANTAGNNGNQSSFGTWLYAGGGGGGSKGTSAVSGGGGGGGAGSAVGNAVAAAGGAGGGPDGSLKGYNYLYYAWNGSTNDTYVYNGCATSAAYEGTWAGGAGAAIGMYQVNGVNTTSYSCVAGGGIYGGAGGGSCRSTAVQAGGNSQFGGNGGAGACATSTAGATGSSPGGGGGGSKLGASGAGAPGQCKLTTF